MKLTESLPSCLQEPLNLSTHSTIQHSESSQKDMVLSVQGNWIDILLNSKREEGIPANDLISEYFGEIYAPWRWFEKQDLIKKYSKEKNVYSL